jgi:hypothetical protein
MIAQAAWFFIAACVTYLFWVIPALALVHIVLFAKGQKVLFRVAMAVAIWFSPLTGGLIYLAAVATPPLLLRRDKPPSEQS